MDVTLDEVQNELREPAYTEHHYQGNQAPTLREHDYRAYQARSYRMRLIASEHFTEPSHIQELRARCDDPEARCFLVLGRREIVGYGKDVEEARHRAMQSGFQASDCLALFYPEPRLF